MLRRHVHVLKLTMQPMAAKCNIFTEKDVFLFVINICFYGSDVRGLSIVVFAVVAFKSQQHCHVTPSFGAPASLVKRASLLGTNLLAMA